MINTLIVCVSACSSMETRWPHVKPRAHRSTWANTRYLTIQINFRSYRYCKLLQILAVPDLTHQTVAYVAATSIYIYCIVLACFGHYLPQFHPRIVLPESPCGLRLPRLGGGVLGQKDEDEAFKMENLEVKLKMVILSGNRFVVAIYHSINWDNVQYPCLFTRW